MNDVPAESSAPRTRRRLSPRIAAVARWLHIYTSVLGLGAVLFFSATGLTLNHPDWLFGGVTSEQNFSGTLPATAWGQGTSPLPQLAIAEYLRKTHALHGTVDEFREDESECTIIFNGPGYSADVTIQRPSGNYEIHTLAEGVVSVLNDLHKGRHTGPVWAWFIDLTAVLLILVSASGIILLCFIKRRRARGFVVALVGMVLMIWLAWKFIP